MSTGRYVLNDAHEPVECPDLMTWARWMETPSARRVDLTELPNGYLVSTVFLGLDHRFGGSGAPIVFETMVFPGNDADRYSTWDEAKAGHAEWVRRTSDLPAVPAPPSPPGVSVEEKPTPPESRGRDRT